MAAYTIIRAGMAARDRLAEEEELAAAARTASSYIYSRLRRADMPGGVFITDDAIVLREDNEYTWIYADDIVDGLTFTLDYETNLLSISITVPRGEHEITVPVEIRLKSKILPLPSQDWGE